MNISILPKASFSVTAWFSTSQVMLWFWNFPKTKSVKQFYSEVQIVRDTALPKEYFLDIFWRFQQYLSIGASYQHDFLQAYRATLGQLSRYPENMLRTRLLRDIAENVRRDPKEMIKSMTFWRSKFLEKFHFFSEKMTSEPSKQFSTQPKHMFWMSKRLT